MTVIVDCLRGRVAGVGLGVDVRCVHSLWGSHEDESVGDSPKVLYYGGIEFIMDSSGQKVAAITVSCIPRRLPSQAQLRVLYESACKARIMDVEALPGVTVDPSLTFAGEQLTYRGPNGSWFTFCADGTLDKFGVI